MNQAPAIHNCLFKPAVKALLCVLVLVLTACVLPQRPDPNLPGQHWLKKGQPPLAQGLRDQPTILETDRALGFDDCVFLAMQQAPGLIHGAVELEIAQLRKDSAYWKQYPEVNMVFNVTTNLTRRNDGETDFWVGFSANSFNPVANHFSYEASMIMQNIAILTHQKAIETMAEQIGEILLRLELQAAIRQKQEILPELARKAVAYWRTAKSDPEYDSIEFARAIQKQKQAQAILDKTDAEMASQRLNLKLLLGLDPTHTLNLESSFPKMFNTKSMGFDQTGDSNWEPAWEANTETRISQLSLRLQDFNIMLAWSRYFPEAGFDLFSGNPVSGYVDNSSEGDVFAVLKLSIPLLDYGNRSRGVEEARLQKTKTKESVRQYRLNFAHRWTQADQSLNLLKATRALTEENLALAKLEAKRATIEFESGQSSFAQVLEGQEKVSQEEIRLEEAFFNLRRQKLNRHFMSGDFSHRFFGPQLTPKNHTPVE
jgi:hypothetical protein